MPSHRHLRLQWCRFGGRRPWRLDDPLAAAALHLWRLVAAFDGACAIAPWAAVYGALLLFLNSLDAIGGASWLPETLESKDVTSWNELFDALLIGIHQPGLSGWTPKECSAIGNELRTWKEKGLPEKEALWSSCYLCNLLTVSILTKVDKNSSWVTTIISCDTCHSASE
ncbi:hypothetical protein Dimus_024239 [Dionaea muscipula]